jgi:hypothetical protein
MLKGKKTDRTRKTGKGELSKTGEVPFFNDWDYRVFADVNGIKLGKKTGGGV